MWVGLLGAILYWPLAAACSQSVPSPVRRGSQAEMCPAKEVSGLPVFSCRQSCGHVVGDLTAHITAAKGVGG